MTVWVYVPSTYYSDRSKEQAVYEAAKAERQMDRLVNAVVLITAQEGWTHAQLRAALTEAQT